MNTSLVDYHCHLDLYPDFESLITECEKKGIYTLTMTTTPKAWRKNAVLTKGLKFVRPALGLHPQLVEQRANEISLWEEYLPDAKFVGEVGLDAGPKFYKSFESQLTVFNHIVQNCSFAGNKVLSIHSVRAANHVLKIVEKHKLLNNNRAVLHWFSGNQSELKKAISIGCFFSINHTMLSSEKGIELFKTIPRNLILTETDGPFLLRDGKPQKPLDVIICVEKIASIWRLSIEETRWVIFNNFRSIETD